MENPKGPVLLVIADLAPPIQGISIVTGWVIQLLRSLNFNNLILNTTVNGTKLYKFRRTIKFLVVLAKLLTSKDFDVLYIPLSHGESLFFQSLFVYVGHRRNKTVLVHHHSYLPINTPGGVLHRVSHGHFLKKAEHIFLSEKMKGDYARIWGETNLRTWVISNHDVALSRLVSTIGLPQRKDSLNFIHFGNISLEKGFFEAVAASEPYLKLHSKSKFNLLGNTSNKDIITTIEALKNNYPNQFFYTQNYSPEILTEILRESDIFLFPSNYKNEAAPVVILEAQALGVFVAATNIGTISSDIIYPGFSVNLASYGAELENLINLISANSSRNKLKLEMIRDMNQRSLEAQNSAKEVFLRWR